VPLAVFCALALDRRANGSVSLILGMGTAAVIAVAGNLVPALLFGLSFIPLGLVLERGISRAESLTRIGAAGTIVHAAAWLFLLLLVAKMSGTNPLAILGRELDNSFAEVLEGYRNSSGLGQKGMEELSRSLEAVRHLVQRALPSLVAITIIGTVWVNLAACRWICLRFSLDYPAIPRFSTFRLPDQLVWLVVVCLMLLLIGQDPWGVAGLNLALALGMLYFLQGLAVTTSLLDRWQAPRVIRILVYLVLLLQLYGMLFISALGLADAWIDFRKKGKTAA